MRSNLLKRLEIIPVFVYKSYYGSHFCILTGFVAAIMVALALILQTIAPFAILRVYCSMASCMLDLSSGLINENSSMQHTPQSARTNAPASKINSLPSRKQDTVSPAEVVPMPVVSTDLCEREVAYYRSCDFPVPGSPTINR